MMSKFGVLVTIAFALGSIGSSAPPAFAQTHADQSAARDGQKDFDWEIGTWTTKVRVRRNPLSGNSPDWADYQGTSSVKPLLGGRANFVELSVGGSRGKIEGGSLRLYNPKAHQWSLNYASVGGGVLTAPVFGGFDGSGRGAFYGQDNLDGRTILVRFIITQISPREARFEQAYSADGGLTWEDNWVAVDTRR
jgi:hypothetical protein